MSQINYKGREINSTSVPFDYILTSWVTIVQFRIRYDRCIKALTVQRFCTGLASILKKYSKIPARRYHKFENETIHKAVNRLSSRRNL